MQIPSFILASKSPVRKKILSDLYYDFTTVPSNAVETFLPKQTISQNAMRLSLEKAIDVSKKYESRIIVGSDSIMKDPNGAFLEKPKDREDAKKMIKNRSGKKETIVSGIAIVMGEKIFQSYEQTDIYWKEFSMQEIDFLLASNEWRGKCGGVMMEGVTGFFAEKIDGPFHAILGFALHEFWRGMEEFA